jgi:AcrR family transcriptional regulator
MVQNNEDAPRKGPGRPRAYDPDAALTGALEAFWKKGYTGTSLDDLSAATGMSRPSLYAAFGDKQALYLKALEHYSQRSAAAARSAFVDDLPLRDALLQAYDVALSIYFSGKGRPRGCFSVGTATTEAVEDPQIRAALVRGVRSLDKNFEARIRKSHEKGELSRDADPAALALLASGTLHTIAIRARAGLPRVELEELARKAVDIICRQ